MGLYRTLALATFVFASAASAQQAYVVTSVSQTYVPLTGATPLTLIGASGSPTTDDGYASVPLPFAFPYYGQTYTSVGVNTNGLILIGPSANTACNPSGGGSSCLSSGSIPSSSSTPNGMIAPWWDDLKGGTGAQIRYLNVSQNETVIEFSDWGYFGASNTFSFQVRLNSSGLIQVHYGSHTGSHTGIGNGWEDPTGTQGGNLLPCGANASCTDANWPTNTLFTIRPPVSPDLMVESVNVVSLTRSGPSNNDITITVQPTIRNIGQNDANNFHWRAWLSTDTARDASDRLIYDSAQSGSPVTVLGANNTTNPTATPTGTGTVTNVTNGNYYVLVEVDTTGVVAEFSETNNLGATTAPFTFGLDLVADSINGPATATPGAAVTLNLGWHNAGTDGLSNPVQYRILLSSDQTLDANDFVADQWDVTVAGEQTCSGSTCTHAFTLPVNAPYGDYYWGLQVDGPGVVQQSRANDVVFSSQKVHIQQADLEIVDVDFVDAITNEPTRVGYFGETGRLTVNFKNSGDAAANSFGIGVVISRDSNLSLLNDTVVHTEMVSNVPAGTSRTVSFNFPIPATDAKGVPYTTGSYFIFAVLDINSTQTEVSEFNNSRAVGVNSVEAINLRTPAADYAVLRIESPSTAAVGEVIPVYRVIKNVGNANGTTVSYRFFASANDIITTEDLPLPILGANNQVQDSADVTLAQGQTEAKTEYVRLPPTMSAGNWYIGVVVDVGNVLPEFDKGNNAGTTSTTVQVAPSAMNIVNQQLPDGTVLVPYAFKLAVTGAPGPVTWRYEGELPDGLTLDSSSGVISGTPTAATIASFTVFAESGIHAAAARLVMRVLPVTGELAIVSTSLPPVINDPAIPYVARLAAAGGSQPYTWSLVSGVLPNGIKLSSTGDLTGAVKPNTPLGETTLVFQVADGQGNTARAALKIRVVEKGALLISSLVVPETSVNADYIADFAAKNADNTSPEGTLTWSIIAGRLPEGLTLSSPDNTRALVTGKATEAGIFPFTLQVVDSKGRSDTADFILRVHPARLKLSAVNPPAILHPGDEVSFQITTGNPQSRYRVLSGALPPGLSLSETGTVSGTVDMENSVGVWNYVVEADSAASGQSLGAFTLEVTPVPVKTGCSAAPGQGGGFGLLAVLASLAALAARKRRGTALAAVAAVALAAGPNVARAQAGYQVKGPVSAPYVALTSGTKASVTNTSGIDVQLPFIFEFFGSSYDTVGISQNGYLTFRSDTGDYSNQGIPYSSTTSPPRVIAVWWDDLGLSSPGQVWYQTRGTAPNRSFVVEWSGVYPYSQSSAKFTMQVELFEGTGRIRMAYSSMPGSSSATVGIQGAYGNGVAGLPCGASGNCSGTNWPTNSVIEFLPPPDLVVTSLSVDNVGYVGVPFQAGALVSNRGAQDAMGSMVRFYLSPDPVFDKATDTAIGDSNIQTVKVGQEVQQMATLTIPSSLAPGNYFLFAEVDPTNAVNEGFREGNNVGRLIPFTIGPPTPDLVIDVVTAPGMLAAGASFQVKATVRNRGNQETSQPAKITYFVSANSVATISDVVLFTGSVGPVAAPNEIQNLAENVMLPANLPAGKYWIGACVDYDPSASPRSAITEISEVNNCATGNSFILNTGALAMITTSLPGATQNSPYGLRLEAIGGDGKYTWSLADGQLPPGMTLTASGDLTGTPSEAGSYSFTVKVSSAGAEQTQALTLEVAPLDLPLTIFSQDLPQAEYGRGYGHQLVAIGGKPPYTWALQQGARLPEGLGLSADGFIEGRASEARDTPYLFTVLVKDSAGTQAAADLQLMVVAPVSMHIATSRLKTAYLGVNYAQDLQAIGGQPPYKWSVVKFQKLAQTAVDVPGPEESKIPDNFGLSIPTPSSPSAVPRLTGKPQMAGLYAITFYVQDSNGAEDFTTLPLTVSYDKPLTITTTVLPDAFVGEPYRAVLSHSDVQGASVTYSTACVQQANASANGYTYSCVSVDASQQLPPGLVLGADGSITGTPAALPAVPAAGADPSAGTSNSMVYSFLVKATDNQGRTDVRSLSIKVRAAPVEAKGGCSGTGLEPAAMALLALAGGLIRRRRK